MTNACALSAPWPGMASAVRLLPIRFTVSTALPEIALDKATTRAAVPCLISNFSLLPRLLAKASVGKKSAQLALRSGAEGRR